MLQTKKRKLIALSAILVVFAVPSVVLAGSLTQGYKAKTDLPRGSVVSLTKSGSSEVEKTTTENDALLVGVVVDATDSLLGVQPAGSQVRVAIDGDVKILVSNVNGDIKVGDKLISTPLAGVAGTDFPPAPGVKYIAVANEAFNDKSSGASKISITQTDNSKKDTYVGLISAKILLGNRTPNDGKNKNVLSTFGKQVTGKDVSLIQVLAAGLVFITTVVLTGMILQGSIRGTFVSLGRNPLSRESIMTGLVRVIAVSIVILGFGIAAAYVIMVL